MRPPHLGMRLRAVLSLVPAEARRVADVGAGHGALSAQLAAEGTRRVIATESQPGPFAELWRNVGAWDLQDRLELRLGRGLDAIRVGEADVVVVAGLSARTAQQVCADAVAKGVRWMVIQCVQGQDEMEPWFTEHAWRVMRRLDVEQRRKRYATWLVEVPA